MLIRKRIEAPKEDRATVLSWWAGVNLPPNLEPCESKDFWAEQSSHGLEYECYVGARKCSDAGLPEVPGWCVTHLYATPYGPLGKGGFFLAYVYSGPRAGQTFYFRWASCRHTFEDRLLGNCYHGYTCKQCGHGYTVDSSD